MPDVFRSPASRVPNGKTVYRGIGGFGGMFKVPSRPNYTGGTKMAAVLDGTSNTIMVVETSDELAIEWTKPDVLAPGNFALAKLFGTYPGGTNAAYVDGSVKFISDAITPKYLGGLFTRNDGMAMPSLSNMSETQKLKRDRDPVAFEKTYKLEADELRKDYEKTSKIGILDLKLSVVSLKVQKVNQAIEDQRKIVNQAKTALTSLESQYKTNPSPELEKKVQAKKSELENETTKLVQLESVQKQLKIESGKIGEEHSKAWSNAFD